MPLSGRARYNLLRQKILKDPMLKVEPWQILNYRDLSTNELFSRLAALGAEISIENFETIAMERESPEELSEVLSAHKSLERDKIYLIVFELWRRLLVDRATISIFSDELDYQIEIYENDSQKNEELFQTLFFELADILDCNVDRGQKPKTVFNNFKSYLGKDLAGFIYHFIDDQIDRGNKTFASEILSNFSEYLSDNLWFDFLRIKLLRGVPTDYATGMMARFLEKLKEKPNFDIYFELLRYLFQTGDTDLFISTYRELLKKIKTEEHFMEMLDIIFEFYNLNDLEKEENLIKELINERKDIPSRKKVSSEDKKNLDQLLI